jgi:hypothetical protein
LPRRFSRNVIALATSTSAHLSSVSSFGSMPGANVMRANGAAATGGVGACAGASGASAANDDDAPENVAKRSAARAARTNVDGMGLENFSG